MASMTCEIARGHVKDPAALKPEHYLLKFKPHTAPADQPKKKSKAIWMKALGVNKPTKTRKPPVKTAK
jgi:hypothetical protein